jgi:hypothetical protein
MIGVLTSPLHKGFSVKAGEVSMFAVVVSGHGFAGATRGNGTDASRA